VKVLRLILIVVLAVLLPLRGVVAASMLCPEGRGAGAAVQAVDDHDHHGHHEGDAHADHGHDHGQEEGASSDHAGGCNSCAASCCASALLSDMPRLPGSPEAVAADFPTLDEPAADHPSDGQDRPPRST